MLIKKRLYIIKSDTFYYSEQVPPIQKTNHSRAKEFTFVLSPFLYLFLHMIYFLCQNKGLPLSYLPDKSITAFCESTKYQGENRYYMKNRDCHGFIIKIPAVFSGRT